MAAYIPVPRDLTRVKSKILFNLTKRQLVCFSLAALMGLPMFFWIKSSGNVSLAAMVMIIVMMPMFLLAMYEKNGQPLEVVARHFIMSQFVRPKVRPYQTNNYYDALMRQHRLEQEVNAIVTEKTCSMGSATDRKPRKGSRRCDPKTAARNPGTDGKGQTK